MVIKNSLFGCWECHISAINQTIHVYNHNDQWLFKWLRKPLFALLTSVLSLVIQLLHLFTLSDYGTNHPSVFKSDQLSACVNGLLEFTSVSFPKSVDTLRTSLLSLRCHPQSGRVYSVALSEKTSCTGAIFLSLHASWMYVFIFGSVAHWLAWIQRQLCSQIWRGRNENKPGTSVMKTDWIPL